MVFIEFHSTCFRLPTSANYPEFISQEYSGSPARSPYINRRILNPTINTRSSNDTPLSGEDMRYAPQIQQRENGFRNYGFQAEIQETANQPVTNVQYYANTPRQTLHVPSTTLPRSLSDTAIHSSVQQNQHLHTYQPEVSHMTNHVLLGFQPEHESSPAQVSWVNSPGFSEINHDLSFIIPRANVPSDQQSYSTADVTYGQTNQMFYSPDNSSEM